jgi:hypothetical protein
VNRWDELFQGQLADEFSGMLTADFNESIRMADEEKESTGATCGRTCSCGPEACAPPDESKSDACDPAGSAQNTACRTCANEPGGCGIKASADGEFYARVPGWSTPPAMHDSL